MSTEQPQQLQPLLPKNLYRTREDWHGNNRIILDRRNRSIGRVSTIGIYDHIHRSGAQQHAVRMASVLRAAFYATAPDLCFVQQPTVQQSRESTAIAVPQLNETLQAMSEQNKDVYLQFSEGHGTPKYVAQLRSFVPDSKVDQPGEPLIPYPRAVVADQHGQLGSYPADMHVSQCLFVTN